MKAFFLQLPGGQKIEIIENPILEKPFAGADGVLSHWLVHDTRNDTVSVGNIYQYVFGFAKWDISKGASMCSKIAKSHLNDLIDKM